MTAVGPRDRALRGVDDRVDDREQVLVVAGELMAVQQRQRVAGVPVPALREREGAGQGPQLPHRGRRPDAPSGHVADDDPQPSVRHRERVVPVSAHLRAEPGDVVGGRDLDAAHLGEPLRDQATLELDGDPMLLFVQLRPADCQRRAVGRVRVAASAPWG